MARQIKQYTLPESLIEETVENCIIKGQTIDCGNYTGTRFRKVIFRNCRFVRPTFLRSEFVEVQFADCDLSGGDFCESYFDHTTLTAVKGVGIRMGDSYLTETTFTDCILRYGDLSRSKWKGGEMIGCDLKEGFWNECKLIRFAFRACDLTRAELRRTMLAGMDLSDSVLDGVVLSDNLCELRGAKIDALQAVGIARRLGIIVKN